MFVVCDKSVRCTTHCMQSTPLYQKSHKKLYISSSRGTTVGFFSSVIFVQFEPNQRYPKRKSADHSDKK